MDITEFACSTQENNRHKNGDNQVSHNKLFEGYKVFPAYGRAGAQLYFLRWVADTAQCFIELRALYCEPKHVALI